MTNEERSQYAKELIKNPLYRCLMDELKANTINLWANTEIEQNEGREKYWQRYIVIETLDKYITAYAACETAGEKVERQKAQPVLNRYP